ncbi:putative synaptobrevin domain-containing protein [Neospora caninum Liverpool]|uniref:Putative synaptobrevin domain-containing protein n=1 Tax=Neospora caninum (strain Liverpool) TaxID=572307 RepID=F0VQI6_NEOCL|nr:putative synaptobrevin domain-containing protein [Neospora caninum Liverpool]CBZ55983.1 putative synaptobrevin domain-containing protein [Neospora caninum Liverpool]CEL70729.1 TPA: synaptobrevin domain-containing protein,putative [Neospora caninum Liverpool]|eukprot:XP_003886009.1 putative synaptobrevin domain-containing protein [Neospora caninum Liverpool]
MWTSPASGSSGLASGVAAARGGSSPHSEGFEDRPRKAESPRFQYACVARGTYVLAEYTAIEEGEEEVLSAVSRRALLKLPKTGGRRSYVFDNRLFSFFVDAKSAAVFMCVTDENIQADIPLQFLTDLRSQYLHLLDASAGASGGARPAEVTRALIRLVDEYRHGRARGSQQVERVEKELEAVTEIVRENINKVLERGEQIECLVGKTSNLRDSAYGFRKASRELRRHVWWSSTKPYFIVFGMIVVLIIILASFFCGGLTFQACLRIT